jgi:endoglucanase
MIPSLQAQDLDETERLLADLTNAFGPPGYEDEVAEVFIQNLRPLVDEIKRDGMGNVIAVRRGAESRPRLMLTAHMDEVGFMVKSIDENGFLRYQTLGGWWSQVLLSQTVRIRTRRNGDIKGIFGSKPPHLLGDEERGRVVEHEDIFVDIGATSAEDAMQRLGVMPGDFFVPDTEFERFNQPRIYRARSWDDRVGLAVMIEVLKRLRDTDLPNTVYLVATTQEEPWLRGIEPAANAVNPDIAIALEIGVTGDTPGIEDHEAQGRLGGGPQVFFYDASLIPDRRFRDFIWDVGTELGLPMQYTLLPGGGVDGSVVQRANDGVPVVCIGVPTRYIHSHNNLIHRDDFDKVVELVKEVALRMDTDQLAKILPPIP